LAPSIARERRVGEISDDDVRPSDMCDTELSRGDNNVEPGVVDDEDDEDEADESPDSVLPRSEFRIKSDAESVV